MVLLHADFSKDGKPLQLRDFAAALRKADEPLCKAYDLTWGSLSHSYMALLHADFSKDGKPLQLRDIAAALRKADDPQGIPAALRAAEALVAACPDELGYYAGKAMIPACMVAFWPAWDVDRCVCTPTCFDRASSGHLAGKAISLYPGMCHVPRDKDGTLRIRSDQRPLRRPLWLNKAALPGKDYLIDRDSRAMCFCPLYLASGYHSIMIADDGMSETATSNPSGH